MRAPSMRPPLMRLTYLRASCLLAGAAVVSVLVADIAVTALNPWADLRRIFHGIIKPDLSAIDAWSVVWTVAFAVVGVALGAASGLALAIVYPKSAIVRRFAVVIRSIHELFWALLLIQVFGLGPLTGVLAIALPYAGIFAKVYAEMLEEADLTAERVLACRHLRPYPHLPLRGCPRLAERVEDLYTLYRLECGMRSTLVLGFIGLPTIGFHLESYFKQGRYAQAAALLGVFYLLIGTRRLWARPATIPVTGRLRAFWAAAGNHRRRLDAWTNSHPLRLRHDIVPLAAPRAGALLDPATWSGTSGAGSQQSSRPSRSSPAPGRRWCWRRVALVAAGDHGAGGVSARLAHCSSGWAGRRRGACCWSSCVRRRSTCWPMCCCRCSAPPCCRPSSRSPSTTAALSATSSAATPISFEQRRDAPGGINLYAFEVVPRMYGQFLAYLLYRWEIIVRESAIFGILGVGTLGFLHRWRHFRACALTWPSY